MKKIVKSYNETTYKFEDVSVYDTRAEPNIFHLPANVVDKELPECLKGKFIKPNEDYTDYLILNDNRGTYYNKETKEKVEINKPEDDISTLTKLVPKEFEVWENDKWVLDIEEKENFEQMNINSKSRQYLSETDWYVIRKQETGKEVPAEIVQFRQEARNKIVEIE